MKDAGERREQGRARLPKTTEKQLFLPREGNCTKLVTFELNLKLVYQSVG